MNFIFLLALLIYIGYVTKSYYQYQKQPQQRLFLVLLFIIHYLGVYLAYKHTDGVIGTDAFSFYLNALYADSWFSLFNIGSRFFSFLIYPLVKSGVSMFTLTLLFGTLSYQGFLWYFRQMARTSVNYFAVLKIPVTQWILLLPSLHYWSGFLGKDALVFFILTHLLFRFKKVVYYNFTDVLFLLILALLRPHIFTVLVLVLSGFYLTNTQIQKKTKIRLVFLSLTVIGVIIPVLMRFIKMKTFTYDAFLQKVSNLNTLAISTGSGINLSESSFIERIWLLLFRPLFYDADSVYQWVVSVENGIVLLFFVSIIIILFTNRHRIVSSKDVKFALFSGIGIFLMIASYIYNLGLASRMRLMFLPFLFYAINQMINLRSVEAKSSLFNEEKEQNVK
ncbi:hypothetical protein [Flavobacterium sp.]|uniref:hypothetical protein n=1 Tax=Flavobacterium sp. TaxID=239 RepID=UPI003D6C0CEE